MAITLVEPDGSAVLGSHGRKRAAEPRHWVLASLIGVFAAATMVIGVNGGVGLTELSERRLIEEYLSAWYGGDYETAAGLTAPQRLRTGPSEQRARDEVAYQKRLGAEIGLGRCETLPPQTVRCEVTYSNVLNDGVGAAPAIVDQQFGVESGMITFVAGPYLEDESMTVSFESFANLLFPTGYQGACVEEPNYQSPDCAEFKLEHLEDWASWHRIEYG